MLAVTYVLRLMALILLTAVGAAGAGLLRAAADRVGGPLVVAGDDRGPGHPGRPGAGDDRGGQGVLHHRLGQHRIGQYLLHMLITICLLYILMRIPFWIARPALTPFGGSPVRRAARFAFTAAVLSRVAPVLRGTAGRAAATARSGQDADGSGEKALVSRARLRPPPCPAFPPLSRR